jgi:hypothetical protein
MADPMPILREKREKAAARLRRAEAAVEAARTEVEELDIALRVLVKNGLGAELEIDGQQSGADASGQLNIGQAEVLKAVPFGKDRAASPKAVHEAMFRRGIGMSADYVRTTLWRLANNKGLLATENGLYWRRSDVGDLSTVEARVAIQGAGSNSSAAASQSDSSAAAHPSNAGAHSAPKAWEVDDDDPPF